MLSNVDPASFTCKQNRFNFNFQCILNLFIFPSSQPYDLLPFRPSYSSSASSTHSFLEHWRMIYRFLDTSSGPTQALPPHCCPVSVGMEYTASDHRRDVLLKATYLGSKEVIITPARPPPSAASLCLKKAKRNEGSRAMVEMKNNNIEETKIASKVR